MSTEAIIALAVLGIVAIVVFGVCFLVSNRFKIKAENGNKKIEVAPLENNLDSSDK